MKRTHAWNIALSTAEHEIVVTRFKQSTHRTLSSYVRDVLLHKPIVTRYRNQSFDDYLATATALKTILEEAAENMGEAELRQKVEELIQIMIKIQELCTGSPRRR